MFLFLMILAVALAIGLLALLVCNIRAARSGRVVLFAANLGVETHEIAKSYIPDEAIATRYLLGTIGSTAAHVAICAADEIPIGVITDEASADEVTAGKALAVELLGISHRTLPMVASEAITAGEAVFAAAAGKVQDLPAGAGTYYQVGYALTAAAADGDTIEVQHHAPRAVTVS